MGQKNVWAKLTDERVIAMRRDFKRISPHRSNLKELARQYGVAYETALNAIKGITWKHL